MNEPAWPFAEVPARLVGGDVRQTSARDDVLRDRPRRVAGGSPRWIRWVSLIIALTLVAVALFTTVSSGPSYSATAIVVATPRSGSQVGSDVLEIVTTRYLAYLTSPSTQRRVAEEEGISLSIVEQSKVTRDPGTINIAVTSEAPTSEIAQQVANALASAAVAYSSTDELMRVEVLAPAVLAR